MHADDTTYCQIKDGIIVVSGNAPAIRIAENRLVIRDGPKETPPLVLTRAAAGRKLRHVLSLSDGGYVSFAALHWLHDIGVGFSTLDYAANTVIAGHPKGLDKPSLRRAQALASGNARGVMIARQLLISKLRGQSAVRIGKAVSYSIIDRWADKLAQCKNMSRMLIYEAKAGAAYWADWEALPVRFAHRRVNRVPDEWRVFGKRSSELTGNTW